MAPDETQLLYSIVLHGRAEIDLAPDEYSGLVMVLLRLLAFAPASGADLRAPPAAAPRAAPPVAPVSTAGARPASGGREGSAAPKGADRAPTPRIVAAQPEPPPWLDLPPQGPFDAEPVIAGERISLPPALTAPAPTDLQRTPLGDRWEQHVRALLEQGSVTAMARELALQAECIAIDGTRWQLRVERESLRAPAQRERLQAALREAVGEAVTLQVDLGATNDTPARREAAERERRQQEAERIIHDDPLVQALLHQYSTARIVPGSVKPH
jgi:DNA polymerase-3 subunit gamma/tau